MKTVAILFVVLLPLSVAAQAQAPATAPLPWYSWLDGTEAVVVHPLTWHGWKASTFYDFAESPFSTARNRVFGATLGYGDGPFNVHITYQRKKNWLEAVGSTQPVDLSARNALIAARWNLGGVTLYAGYGMNKGVGSAPWDERTPYGALLQGTPSINSRDALAGIAIPRGPATFMLSYVRKNDLTGANFDSRQVSAGMTYAVSRNSLVYAAYANSTGPTGNTLNFGYRRAF